MDSELARTNGHEETEWPQGIAHAEERACTEASVQRWHYDKYPEGLRNTRGADKQCDLGWVEAESTQLNRSEGEEG